MLTLVDRYITITNEHFRPSAALYSICASTKERGRILWLRQGRSGGIDWPKSRVGNRNRNWHFIGAGRCGLTFPRFGTNQEDELHIFLHLPARVRCDTTRLLENEVILGLLNTNDMQSFALVQMN